MAARHSITIQLNSGIPGHAAVVVNEPSKQTYAGFARALSRRFGKRIRYRNGCRAIRSQSSSFSSPQDATGFNDRYGGASAPIVIMPTERVPPSPADQSAAPADDRSDWFTRWVKPLTSAK